MVAYHLFDPAVRGKGIGTRALRLLVQFVEEHTDLTLLTSITSRDNIASRRIALKCGFREVGAPREDPLHGVVYQLPVPARAARSG